MSGAALHVEALEIRSEYGRTARQSHELGAVRG